MPKDKLLTTSKNGSPSLSDGLRLISNLPKINYSSFILLMRM